MNLYGFVSTSLHHEKTDMESLRSELRDKNTRLSILQANQQQNDLTLAAVKENHTKLLEQTEKLNNLLREEKRRAMQLESELSTAQLATSTLKELSIFGVWH